MLEEAIRAFREQRLSDAVHDPVRNFREGALQRFDLHLDLLVLQFELRKAAKVANDRPVERKASAVVGERPHAQVLIT